MIVARPYQDEDLFKIKDHYYRGERRLLLVWATGLGKTVAFSKLPSLFPQCRRMLVIVNRKELVRQTVKSLKRANPGLKVGVEQASNRHSQDDDVVVVSIQTVGGTQQDEEGNPIFNKRLLTLDWQSFDIIVADEAHRAIAKSWIQTLKHLRVYKGDPEYNDPNKLLLCTTATPNRGDNKGLEEICDHIAAVRDIRWGIQNGWLADIEAYRVNTKVDISDIKITQGDFDRRELTAIINTPARNKLVVEKYTEITGGKKKSLFFTQDIAHAKDLAAVLNESGIKTLAVYSGMGDDARDAAFEAHKSGEVQNLCGAQIFLEGYDDPTIEVICMVKPTKSNTVYTQAIGRGLRPFPAPESLAMMRSLGDEPEWIKECCLVIDFVDVSSKHSLITVPTLFGLSSKLDLKGKKVSKTLEEIEAQVAKVSGAKKSLVQLDKFDDMESLTAHIERVDLLSLPQTPASVAAMSELSWVGNEDKLTLSTPDITYSVQQNTLGNYSLYTNKKGVQQYLSSAPDLKSALKAAEANLDDTAYQNAKNTASWKKEPPTASQCALLAKIDKRGSSAFDSKDQYIDHIMKNLTRFNASAMITGLLGQRGR